MWAGSAMIVGVEPHGRGSQLTVRPPSGPLVTLDLDERADPQVSAALVSSGVRPLAVQLRSTLGGFECSVLAAGVKGPRRVPVSLPGALALCESGVHGVVRHDLGAEVAPGPDIQV
jgi:hypothetical protein